jgi:hypothetical protein
LNNLLLLNADGCEFNRAEVKEALEGIEGVYNLREGDFIGSILDCEFDFENDSTIVRLSDDLKTIEMTGVGDSGLRMALELQRSLTSNLRMIDWAYTFDIRLSGIESFEALRAIVDDAL